MRKKKSAGKKWLVALVLFSIILMIGSSLIIGLNNNQSSNYNYNNFKFTYQNRQWKTVINNYQLEFYHHPTEVDYLNISNPEKLNSPLIYLTFNPNQTNEYLELSRLKLDLTAQLTQTYFSHGNTQPSEEYNFPIITCQNATPYAPVIFYQKSNHTSISFNNNCYILNAQTKSDYLKLTERIIYQILGVING